MPAGVQQAKVLPLKQASQTAQVMPFHRRCLDWIESTFLCGRDVDDIFSLSVHKVVRIRDAKLGLLQRLLNFAVVIYLICGPILKDNG